MGIGCKVINVCRVQISLYTIEENAQKCVFYKKSFLTKFSSVFLTVQWRWVRPPGSLPGLDFKERNFKGSENMCEMKSKGDNCTVLCRSQIWQVFYLKSVPMILCLKSDYSKINPLGFKLKVLYHRERILETSTLSCNEEEEEITKPPKR